MPHNHHTFADRQRVGDKSTGSRRVDGEDGPALFRFALRSRIAKDAIYAEAIMTNPSRRRA